MEVWSYDVYLPSHGLPAVWPTRSSSLWQRFDTVKTTATIVSHGTMLCSARSERSVTAFVNRAQTIMRNLTESLLSNISVVTHSCALKSEAHVTAARVFSMVWNLYYWPCGCYCRLHIVFLFKKCCWFERIVRARPLRLGWTLRSLILTFWCKVFTHRALLMSRSWGLLAQGRSLTGAHLTHRRMVIRNLIYLIHYCGRQDRSGVPGADPK